MLLLLASHHQAEMQLLRETGARNLLEVASLSCATPTGHKQYHNFVLSYGQCRNHHFTACTDLPSPLQGTTWIHQCWGPEPLTDLRLLANNKKYKEETL